MAKQTDKKDLRSKVETKLAESFADIKAIVGDKKFSKKIKKAGKIIAAGATAKTKKAAPKKVVTKKVAAKKTQSKTAAPKKVAAK